MDYFIFITLGVGFLVGLGLFIRWSDKRIAENAQKGRVSAKERYDIALDALAKSASDPQLRADATEKGHKYYWSVANTTLRTDPSFVDYINDRQARETRVQADIESKIKKGK